MEHSLSVVSGEVADSHDALRYHSALAGEGDLTYALEGHIMALDHAAGGVYGVRLELDLVPRRGDFDADIGQRVAVEELRARPYEFACSIRSCYREVSVNDLFAVAVTGRAGHVDDGLGEPCRA